MPETPFHRVCARCKLRFVVNNGICASQQLHDARHERRLALAEQLAALDETAGAWSDERHPEMLTEEDIDRWLADLCRS